jgi:hypothetical protein
MTAHPTDISPIKPKHQKRAGVKELFAPYLANGIAIELLEVVREPDGAVRVFVRDKKERAVKSMSKLERYRLAKSNVT